MSAPTLTLEARLMRDEEPRDTCWPSTPIIGDRCLSEDDGPLAPEGWVQADEDDWS